MSLFISKDLDTQHKLAGIFSPALGSAATFFVWFKPVSTAYVGSHQSANLLRADLDPPGSSYRSIQARWASGGFEYRGYDGSASVYAAAKPADAGLAGTWLPLMLSKAGHSTRTLYTTEADGSVISGTEESGATASTVDLTIGSAAQPASDYYIAEVAIWTAGLTAEDFDDLRNGALPSEVKPDDLYAYYSFSEDWDGSIGVIPDLSGNERDITAPTTWAWSADHPVSYDAGPTIGPISTDDTVTQGETGITFRVSGFESAPDSVAFNSVSLAFTQELVVGGEGDIDVTLTDPIPLNLEDGSYDLVVSNDDETATKSIGYVVTHPIALPDPGEYDSNSILSGAETSFPAGTYALLPTLFVGDEESITPTFKAPYTSWADADLTQSIDDILEAPEGVVGLFSATAEALFPDGTTDTWVITLNVEEEAEPVDPPTFSGTISNRTIGQGKAVSINISSHFTGATSYSADGLPDGLTISSAGVISGTPTTIESASVTITGTNSGGSVDSNEFAIEVVRVALTYYVSDSATNGYALGSDSNDGLSKAEPFLTIDAALAATMEGDIVYVNAGLQYGDIALRSLTRLVRGEDALIFAGGTSGPRALVSRIAQPVAN